jgi:hypothetical protein
LDIRSPSFTPMARVTWGKIDFDQSDLEGFQRFDQADLKSQIVEWFQRFDQSDLKFQIFEYF